MGNIRRCDGQAKIMKKLNTKKFQDIRRLLKKHFPTIKSYQKVNDSSAIFEIALVFLSQALLLIVTILFPESVSIKIMYILAVAILFVRTMVLEHEAAHQNLFTNPQINDIFGIALGCMALNNFRTFKSDHLQHHREAELNEIGHDKKPSKSELVALLIRCLAGIHILEKLPIGPIKIPFLCAVLLSTFSLGILYFIVTFAPLYISIPVLYIFACLGPGYYFRALRGRFEHYEAVSGQLQTNTFQSNFINNIFAPLGMIFHLEHHLFPQIPSAKLLIVRELLQSKIKDAEVVVQNRIVH